MTKKAFFKTLLPFLPLLGLYVILILAFSPDQLVGDEARYIRYASSLADGYYTTTDNPSLRNGPGYPLVITLPVLIDASHDMIRLLNILFLLAALVFFYKTLAFYLKPPKIILLCYLLGLYPPVLRCMINILSESLALFFICGFLYHFIKLNRQGPNRNLNLVLSAFFLGFLALTKVIFGYVILCGILGCLILYLLKKSKKVRFGLLVFIGSFIICIPYLSYTYSVTGKMLLWGTQGGEMLYWRSSPFEKEYGDWISSNVVLGKHESEHQDQGALSKNHGDFLKNIMPYSEVQKDSLFKEKAIENIKRHPLKYLKNTGASLSRLFFNFPKSYMPQKLVILLYVVPNAFLLVFLIISIYLAVRNGSFIPFEIRFLGLTALIFILGLSLLDGKVRHLLPIIPVLILLIVFVFSQNVELKLNARNKAGEVNAVQ